MQQKDCQGLLCLGHQSTFQQTQRQQRQVQQQHNHNKTTTIDEADKRSQR